ncbi:MAG: type II/IV secretion system protein [Phycisphaerales bacterium]|nr:type II/IV secretion system protein [Phycisphaerales bacterium]
MNESAEFLGKALVEEGLLSRAQLSQAAALAGEADCTLDEAIETLALLPADRIAMTKAQICEAPYADLSQFEINLSNCRLIPRALARQHLCIPLFVIDDVVALGIEDPLNLQALDQVRQLVRREVDPILCEPKALRDLIERAYALTGVEAEDRTGGEVEVEEGETGPIVLAVNTLLADAIRSGASDVHVNPDQGEMHIRYRIDGVLHKRQGPPLSMHSKIVQRLKVMAGLDVTQTRRPQDGKFRFVHGERRVDVRLSVMPTVTGENAVIRILNAGSTILTFAELGIDPTTAGQLEQILAQPHGMLLVTGPTGSGKTTTLYSAISRINTLQLNIITIEDPVEIRVPLVRQVQVNPEIGLTFASTLRSVLRQDPDVVLVGEIRDEETAAIALQASLTGHLVLSTLHTNDAAGAIARLTDFGLPPFVINSAVSGVLAQRLVRRVCEQCAAPDDPAPFHVAQFDLHDVRGLRRGQGCPRCLQSGYQGRIGLYELIRFSAPLQEAVAGGSSTDEIRRVAMREGARLMWQDGLDKARMGLTTIDEVARMVMVDQTAYAGAAAPRRMSA